MIAKSGDRLIDEEAVGSDEDRAAPPGVSRHAQYSRGRSAQRDDAFAADEDRREAARRIAAMGATAVLIKGGHLPDRRHRRPACSSAASSSSSVTRAYPAATRTAPGARLPPRLRLIWRWDGRCATRFRVAQRYIADAIRHAPDLGKGHGPMQHFVNFKVQSAK